MHVRNLIPIGWRQESRPPLFAVPPEIPTGLGQQLQAMEELLPAPADEMDIVTEQRKAALFHMVREGRRPNSCN